MAATESTRPGTVAETKDKDTNTLVLVLRTFSVVTTSVLFLPGLFVRLGSQFIVAQVSGFSLTHDDFTHELGGELEGVTGRTGWTQMLIATTFIPQLLGAILLLPGILGSSLLGINIIPTVSLSPQLIVSHDTSLLPFLNSLNGMPRATFFRIWMGFSCFYCSVPSRQILDGAGIEAKRRPTASPIRLLTIALVTVYRMLRAIDSVLLFWVPGAYLASGLIPLVLYWEGISLICKTVA